jgi:hypothetical protein
MKSLLVIGCGRSGTRYTAKALRSVGLNIGHEKLGKHGMVDWHAIAVPSSMDGHDIILHQVREPLAVIASFHTVMRSSWRFIEDHDHRISMSDPLLLRCMKYWLYWNQRCEKAASRTYRVEDIDKELPIILSEMESNKKIDWDKIRKIPTNDHTRDKRQDVEKHVVTWDDMLSTNLDIGNQILRLSDAYGYKS